MLKYQNLLDPMVGHTSDILQNPMAQFLPQSMHQNSITAPKYSFALGGGGSSNKRKV